MALDFFTVKTAGDEIDRSHVWVLHAIRLGKFEAEKVGSRWLIPGSEIRRFKREPFKISRKEMVV